MTMTEARNGYHLLYESSTDSDQEQSLFSNPNPPIRFKTGKDVREKQRPTPVSVIHDEPEQSKKVTVASKNGLIHINKDALPPLSKVRSRSSGQQVSSSLVSTQITSALDDNGNSTEEEQCFVWRKVEQHDTLQGIALQYASSVAEIKRVNALISDVDLHGLTSIRIPIAKHSVLLETEPTSADQLSPVEKSRDSTESENDPVRWLDQRTVSINQAMLESADLLQSDLSTLCSSAFSRASTVHSLHARDSRRLSRGADGGLSWQTALGIMLLVCVAIPFIYLLYRQKISDTSISDEHS